MTPNEFYRLYGKFIFQSQRNRNTTRWPYLSLYQDAVDGDLFQRITNQNPGIIRFARCGFNYTTTTVPLSAILYRDGYITYNTIYNTANVISYEFGGCYMAKFNCNGVLFACHIYSNGGNGSRLRDFLNFIKLPTISNVAVFRPTIVNDHIYTITNLMRNNYMIDSGVTLNEAKKKYQICGLITNDNRYYSIGMDVDLCIPYHIEERNRYL